MIQSRCGGEKMLPTREEAQRILEEAAQCNPGKWVAHSRVTGECAEKIARQVCDMDADTAYIVAILHDIGRKFGAKQMAHSMDGYRYLHALGYEQAAKICITHSFPTQMRSSYIGKMDLSQEDENEMARLLASYEYDDYDRLVQLCDAVALPEGAVNMETRLDDVAARYGCYPSGVRERYAALKVYFERKMNRNLYEVLGI